MAAEMSRDTWFFQCMDCEFNVIAQLTAPEFERPEDPEEVKHHVSESGHRMNSPQKIG